MRFLRSRHTPMLLSLALFGLLIWWTNTPKRPSYDAWLAEHYTTENRFVLDFSADMSIDALAYDHITVSDTLNHHLQLLALAFPDVRQDARLDACCPGLDTDALSVRASVQLRFGSRARRSAFLTALQAVEGLRLHDQQALATGFSGHGSLDLDIPGSEERLLVSDMGFRVQHAELL